MRLRKPSLIALQCVIAFACGLVFSAKAAQPEYVISQAVTVKVAGQDVRLGAGKTVSVISTSNGMAMIQVTLVDGSKSVVQIPEGNLQVKKIEARSPAPSPSAPPPVQPAAMPTAPMPTIPASATPSPATPPSATPAPATPAPQPSLLKPGWSEIQLPALPSPAKKPKWFKYDFDPAKESFHIYVPRNYDPHTPCGVIGWTNAGDGFDIPKKFEALYDEFGLIVISAKNCGNQQDSDRRAGLLVSAMLELSKMTAIDQHRLLLSGISGGGRLSALGCFVHPEIFCGAISWCGGNFYKDYPDSEHPGRISYGIPHAHKIDNAVTSQNAADAKKNVKFVLLTGSKDSNLVNSRDIHAAMKKEGFKVLLVEEPDLGHNVGSPEIMRQALVFVLGEPQKK